ncbi:hypothetical protein F5890DRAFT_1569658 [Lentinula detonsa]|uniref:Uncharacterized protein n=1 Tax=Lentinula detonsa TaxID=2804962 RepID=A0AA38PME9_9AGAR|nr:hypothetical protein F5890DRAFT_1569658 [Lentinula detonsa]
MRFNVALLILGLTSFAAALPMESNPSPEPHSPAAARVTGGISSTNGGGTSGLPVLTYTFTGPGIRKSNPARLRADAPELVEEFLKILGMQGKCAEGSKFYGDKVIYADFADSKGKKLYYGFVQGKKESITGYLNDEQTNAPVHIVSNGKVVPNDEDEWDDHSGHSFHSHYVNSDSDHSE